MNRYTLNAGTCTFGQFLTNCRTAGKFEAEQMLDQGEIEGIDPLEIGREALRRAIEESFNRQNFRPKLKASCLKAALDAFDTRVAQLAVVS